VCCWRTTSCASCGRASKLELEAQLPAGMFQATAYRAQSIRLQPADRLVLVTDGVLEAGALLRTLRSYAPRMHDDATVICLDWNGPTTAVPA